MVSPGTASQTCHTCRRRRRKCDRRTPICQKCADDGLNCLGYGKLILWERGVASRGKMMNRTFSQASSDTPQVELRPGSQLDASNARAQSNFSWPPNDLRDSSLLKTILVDPFVQRLDRSERCYLSHYSDVLVRYYVLYDVPGKNPMRQLMSTVQGSSVLLHGTVANAAFHIHNISSGRPKQLLLQSRDAHPTRQGETIGQANSSSDLAATSLQHALEAKQKALSLLSQSLQRYDPLAIDITLATIVILVNHELLDAGKDGWRVHIQGAQKLIAMLGGSAQGFNTPAPMNQLRMFCLCELLVLSILGTTLTYSAAFTISIPSCIASDSVFLFAERYNYLSCPAPLLKLMLRSLVIPNLDSGEAVSNPTCSEDELLVLGALAFDPRRWLESFEPTTPLDSLEKRFHIASALRSAVCLFLGRRFAVTSAHISVQRVRELIDTEHHVSEIVRHVSVINLDDAMLQSTCWPVFLAGLTTQSSTQRLWVRQRLSALWDHMHWGYICTAQEILDIIWSSANDFGNGRLDTTKYLIC